MKTLAINGAYRRDGFTDRALAAQGDAIERAGGLVFASPTNFGTVTALFKRFMERLVVYGYWPWGAPAPKMRKAGQPRKPALLISSSAAPGLLARFAFLTRKPLKQTATTVGAEVRGGLHVGLAGVQVPSVTARQQARLDRLAKRLLA